MLEIAPVSPTAMSYDDALLYCQFLEHDGYRDWRMPTAEEYDQFIIGGRMIAWYVGRRQYYRRVTDGSCVEAWVYPVRNVC
jgi:hypothetical protein